MQTSKFKMASFFNRSLVVALIICFCGLSENSFASSTEAVVDNFETHINFGKGKKNKKGKRRKNGRYKKRKGLFRKKNDCGCPKH